MSKERARRRAERQADAAERLRQHRQRLVAEAVHRRRRERWRRLLPWRAGRQNPSPLSARRKERRATIASVLLVVVVLTYLMTRSIAMVIGVLLVAAIATPALAAAFLDRSKK